MFTKRRIKIVILFVLMLIVILCGWHMYKRLDDNKQFFDTDIYTCISPQAKIVININRNHYFEELYKYEDNFRYILEPLKEYIAYPIIIYGSRNNDNILLMKISKEQEIDIRNILEKKIAPSFAPKEREYKDSKILLYSMSDNQFLVSTYHKGIFALSKNYRSIIEFIDTDPQHTFFSNLENDDIVYKLRNSSPISLFIKEWGNLIAFDYTTVNDSIKLGGYIFNDKDSIDINIPYKLNLSDSTCIEKAYVTDTNKINRIEIVLNKNL